jgi:hypothetical protein
MIVTQIKMIVVEHNCLSRDVLAKEKYNNDDGGGGGGGGGDDVII